MTTFDTEVIKQAHITVINMLLTQIGNPAIAFEKLYKMSNTELETLRDTLVVQYNKIIKRKTI